jgi:hypothetical protein
MEKFVENSGKTKLELMKEEEVNKKLELSKESLKKYAIRKILVNERYLYAEYKILKVIEVVDLKNKVVITILQNSITYKSINEDKIKRLYLDEYIKINVSDIKLNNVSFVLSGEDTTFSVNF